MHDRPGGHPIPTLLRVANKRGCYHRGTHRHPHRVFIATMGSSRGGSLSSRASEAAIETIRRNARAKTSFDAQGVPLSVRTSTMRRNSFKTDMLTWTEQRMRHLNNLKDILSVDQRGSRMG
ncbi:hypothetical protein AVEN_200351-1 [Araneus ventricosus]|uniref:Uncharacterized protein n=1 Tax=Araneus ventricosus TaxID=182803 RepID=A0A4Y2UQG9_ARAVE|nr:hypothetical protein AVEN_200351-1 [Araneus ventricosus]